jgi:hypothetical protein
MAMREYWLREMYRLPVSVRADYVRVLDRILTDLPRRWSRVSGVPFLWYELASPDGTVHIERTSARLLCADGGYPDEFSRWIGSSVTRRAHRGRCAALVKGDKIGAKMSPLPFNVRVNDTRADVILAHADQRWNTGLSLPFSRGVLRRMTFDYDVHELMKQTRESL